MENELGIMPTANWGGSDNHTKLAAITAERDRLRNKNKKLNGLLNYLKMHIDYVMDGDKNAIPEKFWLNAMSQFIERETAALESEDK